MVPRRGLEPPRPFGHQYLKLARLPFRHLGFLRVYLAYVRTDVKIKTAGRIGFFLLLTLSWQSVWIGYDIPGDGV